MGKFLWSRSGSGILTCSSRSVGWTDERLEDWAKLMDRNVSHCVCPLRLHWAQESFLLSRSRERSRSLDATLTRVYRTTSRQRIPTATTRRIADAVAEEQEVDSGVARAEKAIEEGAAEARAEGVVAEVKTSRAAAIRMRQGHEGMTRRCKRLQAGRDGLSSVSSVTKKIQRLYFIYTTWQVYVAALRHVAFKLYWAIRAIICSSSFCCQRESQFETNSKSNFRA